MVSREDLYLGYPKSYIGYRVIHQSQGETQKLGLKRLWRASLEETTRGS